MKVDITRRNKGRLPRQDTVQRLGKAGKTSCELTGLSIIDLFEHIVIMDVITIRENTV